MGRFHGSLAENLTAEAMIHGWEAICKLWQASSMLESNGVDDQAIEIADKTVQQNLRDAVKLLESALEKFSCNVIYGITGQMYNPIVHELDHSDPELEALQQRQENVGSSSGGALSDPLCGAAVATVVRPGLEVSGILRARPRVRVALVSTSASRAMIPGGASATPAQKHRNQQEAWLAPYAIKASSELGATESDNAAFADAPVQLGYLAAERAAATSRQMGPSPQTIAPSPPASTAAVSVSGPASAGGDPRGTEYSEGSVTWREWSPSSDSVDMQEQDLNAAAVTTSSGHRATPSDMTADASVPADSDVRNGGGAAMAAPGTARYTAAAVNAGARGPLQLLLALRAGHGGSGSCGATTEIWKCSADGAGGGKHTAENGGGPPACSIGGVQEEACRRSSGASGVSEAPDAMACGSDPGLHDTGPLNGELRTASDDDRDSGHDDVYHQQYDTNFHHVMGQYAPQWPQLPPLQPLPPALLPQPHSHQPQVQWQQPHPQVLAAAAPGGYGVPSSSSAVPVLLALTRAANCGTPAGRAFVPGVGVSSGPAPAFVGDAAGDRLCNAGITGGGWDPEGPPTAAADSVGGAAAAMYAMPGRVGPANVTNTVQDACSRSYSTAGANEGVGGGCSSCSTNTARPAETSSALSGAAAAAALVTAAAVRAAAAAAAAAARSATTAAGLPLGSRTSIGRATSTSQPRYSAASPATVPQAPEATPASFGDAVAPAGNGSGAAAVPPGGFRTESPVDIPPRLNRQPSVSVAQQRPQSQQHPPSRKHRPCNVPPTAVGRERQQQPSERADRPRRAKSRTQRREQYERHPVSDAPDKKAPPPEALALAQATAKAGTLTRHAAPLAKKVLPADEPLGPCLVEGGDERMEENGCAARFIGLGLQPESPGQNLYRRY
ncbi:hypothetical protein VOLCADRAFT_94455 [Volvox carteri f. nagariensis]|uniref:Uncharacterized protein n=1 Tax=Volvox carteri f. nagariensis TaxID=3068 RepID=D8U4U8_VOLCA|nr:uncharacterized protein VOLCADRAFT_94455 [Volvox carteri f. nagariensis]EFJ45252.1 hypothetical protein VOLCADRAFT_94455 [Volvox carteri f. nagariensis]|eukprot:XP_002953628.1 hypothetical protein VOLCADRAFT_94455 [Volvox carteri f. nagariensis]